MDLIPDVEMPVEEADPPAPEIPEEVPEVAPPPAEDSDDDVLPETEIKEPLRQEEVFKVKKKVKLMISEDEPPVVQPVQKKKRVMSDKQKEALAKGREKALATRRKNAQLRKEEKELKSKKKQKDLEKLRKEVNGTSIDKLDDDSLQDLQKNATAPQGQPKASKKLYTLEDLKEAQEEAIRKGIEGYDTIRKKRKAEKKKKIAKETHDKKVFQDITRATRAPNPDDVWAVCFQ
jgi:hypothetical protein